MQSGYTIDKLKICSECRNPEQRCFIWLDGTVITHVIIWLDGTVITHVIIWLDGTVITHVIIWLDGTVITHVIIWLEGHHYQRMDIYRFVNKIFSQEI
jgi:hypothetical protein